MLKLLVPVDGSDLTDAVVGHLIKVHAALGRIEIHLLNVQIPIDSGHARMFVNEEELQAYHREEGTAALKLAREKLDAAGVPHRDHIVVGHVAETIVRFAKEHAIDQIIMGTHGRAALGHLLMGSVASDVIKHTDRPVTLVK
jgi:nucleotide-binding universal stress UspA family protein